jgi:tellurite resistance protein TehA-like permease
MDTGRSMSWIHHGSQPERVLPTDREPAPIAELAAAETVLPRSWAARELATLDPGWFAWVMASGIVSIGADSLGYQVVSRLTLTVTVVAFVVLTLAYAARIVWFRPMFLQTLRDPTTAMAYFTVVAGTGVLATRLAMASLPLVTLGLGAAAAVIWLVLTYGLPASIVVGTRRPVLRQINGAWLLWVVATQSLSIVAAALAPMAPSEGLRADLPVVAVCLWGLGVMLYLILIMIVFLRLLLVEVTPAEWGPAYWITMGATAISVRAAAGILELRGPHAAPLVEELRPFLTGLSVVLWSFGTWWIPLLVVLGIWRYVIKRYSWAFEPRLWSVVFPLGMYTDASYSLGKAAGFGFMVSIAQVWVFVDLAAWVVVFALMLVWVFQTAAQRPATTT